MKATSFFVRMGLFLKATVIRWNAAMPKYFQAISNFSNLIYITAAACQPDLLEFINTRLHTGLHPLPILGYISTLLAGLASGAKLVSKVTANLATMTQHEIKQINPTQPEIAQAITADPVR